MSVVDDVIFQRFLNAMEEAEDRRLFLILNVRGILFDGTLVGRARYLRELGDTLAHGQERENLRGAHLLRQMFGEEANEILAEQQDRLARGDDGQPLAFAHLVDVRRIVSGGLIEFAGRGMSWRIPVASIDGYSIATLAAPVASREE